MEGQREGKKEIKWSQFHIFIWTQSHHDLNLFPKLMAQPPLKKYLVLKKKKDCVRMCAGVHTPCRQLSEGFIFTFHFSEAESLVSASAPHTPGLLAFAPWRIFPFPSCGQSAGIADANLCIWLLCEFQGQSWLTRLSSPVLLPTESSPCPWPTS